MSHTDPLAQVRTLFDYNWQVREAVLDAIGKQPWAIVEKQPDGSLRSIKDAFLDLLETEAYWAHHVLDGEGEWQPYDRSDATSAERLAMHASGTQRRTAERLTRIQSSALSEPRDVQGEGSYTTGEALLRAASVSLAEAGMLAGRLRALGARVRLPEWRHVGKE